MTPPAHARTLEHGEPGTARSSAARSSASRFLLACLLSLAVAAVTLLPDLDRTELRVEEGRRAWTAREMLADGDWVVPRIWGRPYLAKPPLHPWTIAAFSLSAGEVTPRSTRLPAVMASLALVVALLAFAWRRLGGRGALAAALLLAGAPLFIEKGRLGEIEALLSLCTFLAVASLGLAVERARPLGWAIAAGLALGAALLAKGPPALVFFLGAALGLLATGLEDRRRILRVTGLALALGLFVAGAWAAALFSSLPPGGVLAHWGSELVGQGEKGLRAYLRERPQYVLATLFGMAPGSLVLLLALRRGWLTRFAASPATRLALSATLPPWLLFLCFPGSAARYVFPILPWVAYLGAASLGAWSSTTHPGPARRLARGMYVAAAVLLLAGILVLVASTAAARSRGFDPLGLGPPHPADGARAAAWAAAIAAGLALLALLALRRTRRIPAALLLVLALTSLHVSNQQATDQRRSRRHQAHLAAQLADQVPLDQPLHVNLWGEFNLLFLLDRELVHVDSPTATPPSGYLLLPSTQARSLLAAEPVAFELLLHLPGPRSGPLDLLRASTQPGR
jgi:4-amino-4-deoxy-L-arabinose transferase-like glycosyltransferase